MAKAREPRVPREKEDVREALSEQVGLLISSCASYDAGNRNTAKYMAVTLRALLHQTARSSALLVQLGMRNGRFYEWNFSSQSRHDPKALPKDFKLAIQPPAGSGLGSFQMPIMAACWLAVPFTTNQCSEYVAPLSTFGDCVKKRFVHWWNDVVVRDLNQRTFCRRDLVLNVANTDGGAHVDPNLEQRYMEFSRKNSMGWGFSLNGVDWEAIPKPHLACIRQIAHEVLVTLEESAPWAFEKPYVHGDPVAGRDGYMMGPVVLETGPG